MIGGESGEFRSLPFTSSSKHCMLSSEIQRHALFFIEEIKNKSFVLMGIKPTIVAFTATL